MASMGSNQLGIADLDIGISSTGMDSYKESIKSSLLTTSKEIINNVTEIENAINAGWQGKSRDRFLSDFQAVRENICADLDKEYADLQGILESLEGAYFGIDQSLMDE